MTSPEGGALLRDRRRLRGRGGAVLRLGASARSARCSAADAERFMRFHGVTPAGNFEGANDPARAAPGRGRVGGARARTRAAPRTPRASGARARCATRRSSPAGTGSRSPRSRFGGRVLGEPRYVARGRARRGVRARPDGEGRPAPARPGSTARRGSPRSSRTTRSSRRACSTCTRRRSTLRWLEAALDALPSGWRRSSPTRRGGWFTTAGDHERLLAREKPTHDGAEPSGASVAILNALRLDAFTTDDSLAAGRRRRRSAHYARRARGAARLALTEMLLAVDFATDAAREVVLVWPEGEPAPEPFLAVLRADFLPNRALAGARRGRRARSGSAASRRSRRRRSRSGGRPHRLRLRARAVPPARDRAGEARRADRARPALPLTRRRPISAPVDRAGTARPSAATRR